MTKEEEKLTFKAQELALWYDRDERDSDWNKILSSTKKSLFSVIDCTLCVTPYHSESYLGFGGSYNNKFIPRMYQLECYGIE